MIRSALNLVVVVAMLALSCASSQVAHARDGDWIEVIETYEIPFDPDWRESALKAAEEFREFRGYASRDSSDAKSLAGSAERLKYYCDKFGTESGSFGGVSGRRTGTDDTAAKAKKKKLDAAIREVEAEAATFAKSADVIRSLTVVRAWDGISHDVCTFVFGPKQKPLAARCESASILHVQIGRSNVPDHLQAGGRKTIVGFLNPTKAPTDFLRWADGRDEQSGLCFGELSSASLASGEEFGEVRKDTSAGSGVLTITFQLPKTLPIEADAPWYCRFKLMELDKNGDARNDAYFEGSKSAVSIAGRKAVVRVEVKNPKPFGYVAEATAWFGVAPKAAIKPARQGATSATPPSKSPSKPAAPGDAPSTPEPVTPPITVPK